MSAAKAARARKRRTRSVAPIDSESFFQLFRDGSPVEVAGMTHVGESEGWDALLAARSELQRPLDVELVRDGRIVASLRLTA